MPRPIHFEIPAENPQRAIDFYTKVFGWTIKKWDGPMEYWMITTGKSPEPGIDGASCRATTQTSLASIPSASKISIRASNRFWAMAAAWRFPRCRFPESDGWPIVKTPKATFSE